MRLFSSPRFAFLSGILVASFAFMVISAQNADKAKKTKMDNGTSSLGAFSISLTVKDLNKSVAFYKHLGFTSFADHTKHGYAILKNGNCLIGLFQNMFEKNMLTFNPGWDESAQNIKKFKDIREIEKELKAANIPLVMGIDSTSKSGPASIIITDPDGNPVLIDQHR